jgi:hypothetical protein
MEGSKTYKINIDTGTTILTGIIYANATGEDFISLLPLKLALEDYAGTEKISQLPKRLSTVGAPDRNDASVGDITYFAPWGNLAIFYRNYGYAKGLVKIGKIEADLHALQAMEMTIILALDR